jgi:hypothetical protein
MTRFQAGMCYIKQTRRPGARLVAVESLNYCRKLKHSLALWPALPTARLTFAADFVTCAATHQGGMDEREYDKHAFSTTALWEVVVVF